MKRDVNAPMYRRGPSLYKPSTYCLHVAFLVAQENQAPAQERTASEAHRIVSRVIHWFAPLLLRPSQRVSWSGRPHLEPVSASLHFFSASFAPVARQSQRSYLWENAHCLFKKRPAPFHSCFLNRFISSHETNRFIYLVKRSLTES